MLKLIKDLKEQLVRVHNEKKDIESKVRKELCGEFSKQLVVIEKSWK